MNPTKEPGMDKQDALDGVAFIEGRRAGLGLVPVSLNPHTPGSAEHLQWQQGHMSTTFTVDRKCIAPGHKCPLADGQCRDSCYLADCEPKQEAA